MRIAFFSAKSYEIDFFNKHNTDKHHISYFKDALNEKSVHFAKDHDIVCIFVSDIVSHKVMQALEKYGVGLIALRCAGFDNVCDLETSHPCLKQCSHEIKVVNVPTYSPYAVAEFTVGLMLSVNRKIHRTHDRTKNQDFRLEHMAGFDMKNKTVGIIGLGSIGKIVAQILKGFQMEILVYDPKPDRAFFKAHGLKLVDFDTLIKKSDIITLHTPLLPQTKHMLNDRVMSMMKDDVILVNAARGALIETKALVKHLKKGKIKAVALDVYENERAYFHENFSDQIIQDDTLSILLGMPNVLITPHQAFLTHEALDNIAQTTFENIKEYVEGKRLTHEVGVIAYD